MSGFATADLREPILQIFSDLQGLVNQSDIWHEHFRVFDPTPNETKRNYDRWRYRVNPVARGKGSSYARSARRKELDSIRHRLRYQKIKQKKLENDLQTVQN